MNYRTLAKGALALSLSLIVGSAMAATTTADVQKYGATFESVKNTTAGELNDYAYEEGTNITKYAVTDGNPSGWFGGEADESKIIARTDTASAQALQLNTDAGVLTNKLESTIADDINNNGIAVAGAYIETEAKFVASDTPDAGVVGGTDDTKFAIYAYADESKSPCTTNLVVYHAYYDANNAANNYTSYTNEIFDVLVNTEVYTKLRIEMKKLEIDEGVFQNVFSVSVNEASPLTSNLALDKALDQTAAGIWFQTIENVSDDILNALLSSVTFKGTGEVDNLSVGIIEETTTYAVDWTGSANVVVSNATEALTITPTNVAPATLITFYPTEGNVITNVFVGGVAQTFDPASYAITVNSDTNVVVLAGTQAAQPTVFSVASVGNATVTGDNGVYTITVPEGSSLSSVFVNGAAITPTENQDGTYSIDVSALTGNVNVVVATKKIRTPIGHKWWENPGAIATNFAGHAGDAGPYRFSVGSDFAAISYGNHATSGTGFKLFSVDSLLSGNATPIYTETLANAQSLNISSIRGAAISEALDVALLTAYSGGKAYSLPLSANTLELGVNAFEITNDQGITFDRAYFSADNQYLYTTETSGGTNTKIAKWAIADGLKGSGQKLTLVAEYTMPARVRDFAYAVINNKELFYILQNGTAGVCVYDVAGGTNVQLTAQLSNGGNYGSVAISMTSTSTPTLTVLPSMDSGTHDPMAVYQLTADGLSIANTLATFTAADLVAAGITAGSYIRSAWPSEDDETLYLGYGGNNLYVLQYVEPPAPPTVITVACVNGAEYTEANGVYTFSAPNGYTVSSVFTNGVSANTTSSLDLSAAEGTVKVIVAATKTRTAPAHKWYENPGKVYSYVHPYSDSENEGIAGFNWSRETGDDLLLDLSGWATGGAALYDFNAIEANAGSENALAYTWKYPSSDLRGGAVSKAHNVALFGATSGTSIYAAPLTADAAGADGVLTNLVTVTFKNMLGETLAAPSMFAFSADGKYLFANSGSSGYVYKFALANVNFTDDVELTAVAEYNVGDRVRSFGYGTINNAEVILAVNESKTVKMIDIATGSIADTTIVQAQKPDQICIAGSSVYLGEATGGGTGKTGTVILKRFSIGPNATFTEEESWTKGDFMELTGASENASNPMCFVVSDDEKSLVISFQGSGTTRYLIQYVEPPVPTYAVNWTGSQNVDVTVDGLAWDGGTSGNFTNNTVVTFTPTEGNVITNVNGEAVSLRGLDLTVTEATNIVVLAGVQSQPQGYNYPDDTAITDADQLAWITAKGFSQGDIKALRTNAKFNECYLLNCNIAAPGAGGSIAITGITVDAQGVHVTVALTRSGAYANEGINGTLKLQGTADLATAPATLTTDVSVDNAKFTTDGPATATFTGTGATFFKAIVE